jgi:hypothetical protein
VGLFKVTKTDGETGAKTQCGGTVKTAAKAMDLKARMRAQQTTGDSNSFSIDKA